MKQLLNSRLDLAMDELPYIQDTFSHVFEESALLMYNKIMEQPKPFIPLFTGLNLVKKGTLAYNTDGIYAYAMLKSAYPPPASALFPKTIFLFQHYSPTLNYVNYSKSNMRKKFRLVQDYQKNPLSES